MKTLFLILTCLLMASCTSNILTVEYADGRREQVKSALYDVGDTIYVQHASSTYSLGVLSSVSQSYWCDTIIYQQNRDSTYFLWSYHKVVVIDRK